MPPKASPFDINDARAGNPLVTRGGHDVVFGGINAHAPKYSAVLGWIMIDGVWMPSTWSLEGKQVESNDGYYDLFMWEPDVEVPA